MARTSVSPQVGQQGSQSVVWLVLFYLVGFGVGIGMAVLVGRQLAGIDGGLRTGSPLVREVLALDASRGAGSASAGVGSSVAALSLAMIACATSAAAALIGGPAAAFWADHRRTAHRLTTFGMWLALLVCFAAMLPAIGYPFGEPQDIGPGRFEWHPAPKALAVAAAGGLLLSSITSHRFRRSERRA